MIQKKTVLLLEMTSVNRHFIASSEREKSILLQNRKIQLEQFKKLVNIFDCNAFLHR